MTKTALEDEPRLSKVEEDILRLLGEGGYRDGLEIAETVSRRRRLPPGRLYPALAALEGHGLAESAWEYGPKPRRRLYWITRAGRSWLERH